MFECLNEGDIHIPRTQMGPHILEDLGPHKMEGQPPQKRGQLGSRYIHIYTWNPKQPFKNGCLVKQPFSM